MPEIVEIKISLDKVDKIKIEEVLDEEMDVVDNRKILESLMQSIDSSLEAVDGKEKIFQEVHLIRVDKSAVEVDDFKIVEINFVKEVLFTSTTI